MADARIGGGSVPSLMQMQSAFVLARTLERQLLEHPMPDPGLVTAMETLLALLNALYFDLGYAGLFNLTNAEVEAMDDRITGRVNRLIGQMAAIADGRAAQSEAGLTRA